MSLSCNRCAQTGFLNLHQIEDEKIVGDNDLVMQWIKDNDSHDVQICDCCGDGENWHGIAGEHYNSDDRPGKEGVYGYNGGLCECH